MIALAFSGGKDSLACLYLMRDKIDVAIYVDTGYSYPETKKLVEHASSMVRIDIVRTCRKEQNESYGIPSDFVPVNWTRLGQIVTNKKPVTVQSYIDCCYHNIARPLLDRAKEIGVTELIYGERFSESHKSIAKDGDVVEGVIRRHPIETWSTNDVLSYLATKMPIPQHFSIKHSSLDCYDCTAFRSESADRIEWTRTRHPELYSAFHIRNSALESTFKECQ